MDTEICKCKWNGQRLILEQDCVREDHRKLYEQLSYSFKIEKIKAENERINEENDCLHRHLDYLEAKLLKARVQVEELREALKAISNADLKVWDLSSARIFAEKALTSTGTEYLKQQLADVNEDLEVLRNAEWELFFSVAKEFEQCRMCMADKRDGHTKTCKHNALIAKKEARKRSLRRR